jgi:hypothetical protein
LTLTSGHEGGQAGGDGLVHPTDPVREFLNDAAHDFEEARREEDGADLRASHGPLAMKAEARVVELMKMTGWKVLAVNSSHDSKAIDIVARKGSSTYIAQCVFGSKVLPGPLDAFVSQYRGAKAWTKANALMLISPRAEVPEERRTSVMLQYKDERIEFLGARNWVDELRRPTRRTSSTTNTELTIMSALLAVGAVMVLSGLYLGLNFLLVGAGYIVYIFGAIGVIVGTWYKYRNL